MSTLKIHSKVKNGPSFASCHDLEDLAINMVQIGKHIHFQLVYRLLVLALTLPIATTMVGRAFSGMKFVKIESRNKMGVVG